MGVNFIEPCEAHEAEDTQGVYKIEKSDIHAVAELMSTIKPDWWDYEGASQQLQDASLLAKLVGWYMIEEGKPKGWILCSENAAYSYLGIDCLGYDDNGNFVMEEELEPLLKRAEEYAREKNYRNLKYIIGSTEMFCHGRPILDYAEELRTLKSYGRKHFDYFVQCGFTPAGFIPNLYGENYHGILMIKPLTAFGTVQIESLEVMSENSDGYH